MSSTGLSGVIRDHRRVQQEAIIYLICSCQSQGEVSIMDEFRWMQPRSGHPVMRPIGINKSYNRSDNSKIQPTILQPEVLERTAASKSRSSAITGECGVAGGCGVTGERGVGNAASRGNAMRQGNVASQGCAASRGNVVGGCAVTDRYGMRLRMCRAKALPHLPAPWIIRFPVQNGSSA